MEALHIWVEEYCLSFDITDEQFDNMSDIDKVLMVGRHVFSKPDMSYEELCTELSSFVHLDVETTSDIGFVEECCFICGIHHSAQRDDSVKIIMILEPEYQVYLMNIVKNNMPSEGDEKSAAAEAEEAGDESSSKESTSLSTTDTDTAAVDREEAVSAPDNEETEVQPETDDASSQVNGASTTAASSGRNSNEVLLGLKNNQVVDLELQVMEQNALISQQTTEIAELKDNEERLLAQIQAQEEVLSRHETLQDEVEVYKEKASRLDAAELQIEKYRDKLDELTETKQQYKDEVAAHNAHYTTLLALEAEVESLKKYRTQVEEYRASVAESKIAVNELTVRNAEQAEIIAMYKSHENSSSASQQHSLVHTQTLSAQLNNALERIRELETGGSDGIGGNGNAKLGSGDNELNPVLMQELECLRSTNSEYRKMLDNTSIAHLEELQKTNDDLNVMNTSLQKKWVFTKDSLAYANKEIENYKKMIAQWKIDFKELQSQYHEAALMTEEHNEAEWSRKTDIITGLKGVLSDTKQCLEVVEAEAEALGVTKTNLEHSLKETLSELQSAKQTIVDDSVAHEEVVVGMKRKYTQDIKTQYDEAQAQFTALQEECDRAVACETNKYNAVAVELEEERTKRRRVEREKNRHEADSNRLRMQINASNNTGGSGAGGDIGGDIALSSMAAREFKRMEKELETARAEIAELHQKAAAAAANGGVGDAGLSGSGHGALPSTATGGGATRLSTRASTRSSSSVLHSSAANTVSSSSSSSSSFVSNAAVVSAEQLDMVDKRCAVLAQEKRELISKQMQENQEKLELNQKLIQAEKECAALKAKVTRANLETSRLERKLAKALDSNGCCDAENVHPNEPGSVATAAATTRTRGTTRV